MVDLDDELFTLPTSLAPAVLLELVELRLRELAFVAVSSAGRIEGNDTARLKPSGSPPRRVEDLVSRFKREFEEANTNKARLLVIQRIQERTRQLKYAPAAEKRRGTQDWKVAVATAEGPSHAVAAKFGISDSYVRKLRKALREGRLRSAEALPSDTGVALPPTRA